MDHVPRTPAEKPLDVHVVAHTHWDREWYHPMERFRQRLVALVGELLQQPVGTAEPFLLDGQAVVLDDVLAVHPEWAEALGERLRAGVLEAGPWYVLADELIPSGEAMVRNLLAGRQTLARFGAAPPPVCYSPDAFGHMAALPALADGFGLPIAVVWRGYGGHDWPAGDTVRWRGLGAEVLLWHLPKDGYEYGNALPAGGAHAREASAARWHRIHADAGARSATGVVLLPNGADHHALQHGLPQAIELLDCAAADRATVHRSSLRDWATALQSAAADCTLPVVTGELRNSSGHTWSLQGTFATRSGQKRAVARADRMLRWDVEPWQALAYLTRGAAPSHSPDVALLHAAWRTFLRTLPHDTLCGCSIDDVARALDARVRAVRAQATGLREQALNSLLGRDEAQARERPTADWAPQLVVRNRVTRPRGGVAEVTLLTTLCDVPVGPASAGSVRASSSVAPLVRDVPEGMVVQPLAASLRHARRESPRHYPDNDAVHALRALVWIPESHAVPATGLARWPLISASAENLQRDGTWGSARGSTDGRAPDALHPGAPARVSETDGLLTLSNARLRVTVRDGRIAVFDVVRDREIPDALHVVWQRDIGDSYTSSPSGALRRLAITGARVRHRGPLRASIAVQAKLRVSATPARAELAFTEAGPERTGDAAHAAAYAAAHTTTIRVVLTLSLDANAELLRIDVRVHDRAPDHRLRLVVATGITCDSVTADAAFGPVDRALRGGDAATVQDSVDHELEALRGDANASARAELGAAQPEQAAQIPEMPVNTAPLHRWVSVANADTSCAVLSDGLAEYEAWRDGQIAITLVRATGELSRGNLRQRPGHAGWPARIPGAQGPGRLRARVGLLPMGVHHLETIEQAADALLCPLIGNTWRDAPSAPHNMHTPIAYQGLALRGDQVKASAVALANDGDGIILRAVNLSEVSQTAEWVLPATGLRVTAVRLDETAIAEGGDASDAQDARDDQARDTNTHPSPVCVQHENATHVQLVLAPRAISSLRVTRRAPP